MEFDYESMTCSTIAVLDVMFLNSKDVDKKNTVAKELK
jgi:hypothetical protein